MAGVGGVFSRICFQGINEAISRWYIDSVLVRASQVDCSKRGP